MCNKLLQTYACGHSKSICTTPCLHALESTQATASLTPSTATVIRLNSTVSSINPDSRLPSRNFSRPHLSSRSPLRVTNIPSATLSPTHVPAFRFIPPSTPSPTSPVSPLSPSFASSAPPSRLPSPSPSPSSVAREQEVEPTFCSYFIPRYLMTSKYPCIECYRKGEWEALRARWMENYRLGHPLDKVEDIEVLEWCRVCLGGAHARRR
ncbi:uncharacterized protein M421DRAFT_5536 [Didymella exigua CBS 183.55]|uniref:Uncharacterized protein n=1 Tax=Didymella exigua CBS 183.55 TaxID=1150837 RepID=A0A6A5RQU8_9PLEO|nr:uncharacterized protein M421DRAFT_5536 [Didymella exigua CBS 183.55]KAF1927857.1 hypothetical protein M421DRAFT_5536 [Didymella exigua CBS 183.55]